MIEIPELAATTAAESDAHAPAASGLEENHQHQEDAQR